MSVWYDVYWKDDDEREKHRGTACFSSIYSCLDEVKRVVVFLKEEWIEADNWDQDGEYGYRHKIVVSKEEIARYCKLLKKMGFKLRFRPAKGWEGWLAISMKGNKPIALKVLLNCVRYLYEYPFQPIVPNFLRYANDNDSPVQLFNKLLMAHYTVSPQTIMGHGHSMAPCYGIFKPLQTDKDFVDMVIAPTEGCDYISDYFRSTESLDYSDETLLNNAALGDFNNYFQIYSQILAKG